ncbi:PAS domain S-box protein [Hyphobacterium sp. CCMP332]|nr:PAS domain S-box protein [Hyphobacterium sp. CCMP332]
MIDDRNTLAVLLKQIGKAKNFNEFSDFTFKLFVWLGAKAVYLKTEELNQKYFLTFFLKEDSSIIKKRVSIGNEKNYITEIYPNYQSERIKEFNINTSSANVQNVNLKVFWDQNFDLESFETEIELLQPVLTLKMEQLQLDSKVNKYEEMLANSMDVLMLIENNELEYISPQAFKYLGYNLEELQEAVNSKSIFHPGDKKEIEKKISQDFEKKRQFSKREYRVKLKDGNFRWIQWVVRRIFSENGDLLRMILNFRDVTEKKQAEEEIEHQKLFLQEILDRLPIDIYLKDLNGKYIFINKSAAKTLGASPEKILGKKDLEVLDESIALRFSEEDQKVFDGEHIQEIREIKNKSISRTYLVNKQLVRVDKRKVLLGYSVDITEQKENEAKLLESTEFINKSIQIIPDSIFIFDLSNFSYVFTNDKIFKKLGYSEKDVGKNLKAFIKKIMHNEDVKAYFKQLKDIRKGKKDLYELEYRVYDKDGGEHWMYSKKTPMKRNSKGEIEQFVGLTFEITDQKSKEQNLEKTREKLEKALNAREEFLSIISHEIRTPLNAILGIANLLESSMPEDEKAEMLNILKNSGENLLLMINDILDFSKIRADQLQFDISTFNIEEVINNICKTYGPQIKEKGLIFEHSYDGNISEYVKGDPLRLNQILNNLISNAIKFTDKGKIVCNVRIIQEDVARQIIEFNLKDTGIGIPKNKQKIVFNPFSQINSKTTRKYGGTGLGLSITKELVERQGGVLNLKSEKGEGTEFSVIMAFAKSVQKRKFNTPQNSVVKTFPKGKYKIMYVEDVASNRYLMRAYCNRLNLELTEAKSGEEALKYAASKEFDLILMDLQMPEMDGFKTLKAFRKAVNNVPPVIAITADVSSKIAKNINSAGMLDYISKPMNVGLLYQKLKNILEPEKNIHLNYDILQPRTGKTAHQKLLEIYGGKEEYLEYIKQVNDEIDQCKDQIIDALNKKDFKSFREICHKLTGPIGIFELYNLEDKLNAIKFQITYGAESINLSEISKRVTEIIEKSKQQINKDLTEVIVN